MFMFHSLHCLFRRTSLRAAVGWGLGSCLLAFLAVAAFGHRMMRGGPTHLALLGTSALSQAAGQASSPVAAAHLRQTFAQTPLCFEANQGQTDAQVQYLARGPGYTVFLTPTEAVLTLRSAGQKAASSQIGQPGGLPPTKPEAAVVRMEFVGSNPVAQSNGIKRLPGIANYFLGNDASQWRTHIPTYTRVQYEEVYPGISLVYYGDQQQLEYDFIVEPGIDPSRIRLRFAGAQSVNVDDEGDLVVQVGGQALQQHKPVVYQEVAGERREVAADFLVQGQEVGFALGSYDRSRRLVIDPVLSYSTFLGGSGTDQGNAIAVDAAGNVYVTGSTTSPDFPTVNGLQPGIGSPDGNAFVAKLAADGSALIYSTYLGGSGGDVGVGIAVDAAGNAYITGSTSSPNFPIANPLQRQLGGAAATNAFVTKLAADGSALVYSTYLGGSAFDIGKGIAVNAAGNAFVTGETSSINFPTAHPFQRTLRSQIHFNAFVTKLSPEGSALVYSTYLGGTGNDRGSGIAVDTADNAYVVGQTTSLNFPTVNALQPINHGPFNSFGDAFVTKFSADGSALVYSTFLGGSDLDWAFGIAVDIAGSAYVTGWTHSLDFPTVNAAQPAPSIGGFVAKFTPDGSALVYSTYWDVGQGIAVDTAGSAYVMGQGPGQPVPTTATFGPPGGGISVAQFDHSGSVVYYLRIGGGVGGGIETGNGLAVDAAGNVYVTGGASSPDFPTANALQTTLNGSTNAFVVKISTVTNPGPATQFQISASAQVTSGSPFDVTVTALDANGLVAVGYQGTVTFSTTDADPAVVLPADYTFSAADQGVHTFAGGATLITVGNQTLTATDTADSTITGTATITVGAGP